ncbi:MAG: hypothetical protein RL076_2708, partial [Chloroflexota bacterium]
MCRIGRIFCWCSGLGSILVQPKATGWGLGSILVRPKATGWGLGLLLVRPVSVRNEHRCQG